LGGWEWKKRLCVEKLQVTSSSFQFAGRRSDIFKDDKTKTKNPKTFLDVIAFDNGRLHPFCAS